MIWEILGNLGISFTLAVVLAGALLVGITFGIIGFIFVSQRMSVMGDAISHSSLPGVVLAFIIVGRKDRISLLVGAFVFSVLVLLLTQFLVEKIDLKEDLSIAISLSLFFSLGVALLTFVQGKGYDGSAGLNGYIFGNISFLRLNDLFQITSFTVILLLVLRVFWKEYRMLLFDREFAIVNGYKVQFYDVLLILLTSGAIVIGVETVGVILVAGLLISPAIAARQWSDMYNRVMFLSGTFGGGAAFVGVMLSAQINDLPPGPAIIVVSAVLVIFSLLFGYKHGVASNWLHMRMHVQVDHADLVKAFLSQTDNLSASVGLKKRNFLMTEYPNLDPKLLSKMVECGYCERYDLTSCSLTAKGFEALMRQIREKSGD